MMEYCCNCRESVNAFTMDIGIKVLISCEKCHVLIRAEDRGNFLDQMHGIEKGKQTHIRSSQIANKDK